MALSICIIAGEIYFKQGRNSMAGCLETPRRNNGIDPKTVPEIYCFNTR